jgi:hypothetical protein
MRVIKIYVEGKSDLFFLIHLLESMFEYKFLVDARKLQAFYSSANEIALSIGTFTSQDGQGGIDSTKINAVLKQINDVDSKLGIESVFLIDADTDQHVNPPGGVLARTKHMEELRKLADFKYFLIPNHSVDGNLETILQSIICNKGQNFYKCLHNYAESLLALNEDDRPMYVKENPKLQKERIGWYIYMMEGKGKKTEKNKINPELWNLNAEILKPLKGFLNSVIKG